MTTEIETMLRSIVPDLAGVPLYVVFASELPTRELLPSGARGFAGADLDMALRPFLDSHDLWAGRGPAIILDDELIRSDAEILSLGEREIELGTMGVGLHEMAHALEADFELEESDDYLKAEVEQQHAADMAILSADLWSAPLPKDIPSWFAHESEFIRMALHLQWRAGPVDTLARAQKNAGDSLKATAAGVLATMDQVDKVYQAQTRAAAGNLKNKTGGGANDAVQAVRKAQLELNALNKDAAEKAKAAAKEDEDTKDKGAHGGAGDMGNFSKDIVGSFSAASLTASGAGLGGIDAVAENTKKITQQNEKLQQQALIMHGEKRDWGLLK